MAFEESELPIFVDVIDWGSITLPRLREEIERDAIDWIVEP